MRAVHWYDRTKLPIFKRQKRLNVRQNLTIVRLKAVLFFVVNELEYIFVT